MVGNTAVVVGWIVRGPIIAIGWALKKVPGKAVVVWGPWSVGLLVLGFHGQGIWRGARAWKKGQSDWLARGEGLGAFPNPNGNVPDGPG